jgi:hypothetical protein
MTNTIDVNLQGMQIELDEPRHRFQVHHSQRGSMMVFYND